MTMIWIHVTKQHFTATLVKCVVLMILTLTLMIIMTIILDGIAIHSCCCCYNVVIVDVVAFLLLLSLRIVWLNWSMVLWFIAIKHGVTNPNDNPMHNQTIRERRPRSLDDNNTKTDDHNEQHICHLPTIQAYTVRHKERPRSYLPTGICTIATNTRKASSRRRRSSEREATNNSRNNTHRKRRRRSNKNNRTTRTTNFTLTGDHEDEIALFISLHWAMQCVWVCVRAQRYEWETQSVGCCNIGCLNYRHIELQNNKMFTCTEVYFWGVTAHVIELLQAATAMQCNTMHNQCIDIDKTLR